MLGNVGGPIGGTKAVSALYISKADANANLIHQRKQHDAGFTE